MRNNSYYFFHPTEFTKDHPITGKLLVFILLFSTLMTLLTTLVQLLLDYRTDINAIEQLMRQIEVAQSGSLAAALWDINEGLVQMQLEGILELPDIEYAVTYDEFGDEVVSAGKQVSAQKLTKTFDLVQDAVDGQRKRIGSITLEASLEGVFQRLTDKIIVILLSQGVKTFFVSIFILLIVRFLLTRHLDTMAEFAEELDLDQLDKNLALNRKPNPENQPDELDRVVNALNEMTRTIKKSSLAMAEKSRMEGELKAATMVQNALFPKRLPEHKCVALSSFFEAASETGGDWYGFVTEIPGHLYILIGDVTGHGIPAALITANVAATTKTLENLFHQNHHVPTASEFMNFLNKAVLSSELSEFLMTFFIADINLDTGLLIHCNAGHNPPIIISNNLAGNLLNHPPGGRLGWSQDSTYTEQSFQLGKGDLIFFYTDGLTENENPEGEMWGERKLVRYLKKNAANITSKEIIGTVVEKAYTFYDNEPLKDDVTMIACQVTENFV